MRIVIHMDKRTASAPCKFDLELDTSSGDHPLIVEYGRYMLDKIRENMGSVPGFEESNKPLRGVPSAKFVFLKNEGRWDLRADSFDNAPHYRVALNNFLVAISKELDGMEVPKQGVSRCESCRHFARRVAHYRATWTPFAKKSAIGARLTPFCRAKNALLSLVECNKGCDKHEPK